MATESITHKQPEVPLLRWLRETSIPFVLQEPLARHCTWRIGGPADILAKPTSPEQISALVAWTHQQDWPCLVIGKGSNLLFDDAGVRGLVIKIDQALSNLTIRDHRVRAQTGLSLPRLACQVAHAGLTGLEHIVGIPGNLGGLVVMNGGSLRQTIGDVTTQVTYIEPDGCLRVRQAEDCDFHYRHSWFQNHPGIVVEANLELSPGDPLEIRARMREILNSRRDNFPLSRPNCGSVFKNSDLLYHTAGPPGRAIESLGLKGLRFGDAEISHQHANFIINHGRATCHDTLTLIRHIADTAAARLGCELEAEVKYVDTSGKTYPATQRAAALR